jgi:hypothetical protein
MYLLDATASIQQEVDVPIPAVGGIPVARGDPNVEGPPAIERVPVPVVRHGAVLPNIERGTVGLGVTTRGANVIRGARGFGGQSNGWRTEASDSNFGRAQRNAKAANRRR